MKILFTLALCILTWSMQAKVFYQSGYEAENEPFGNWKVINRIKPGAATTAKAFSGKSSRTPGFGKGRYGRSFAHNFKPELKADKIWVSYRMYGEEPGNYFAFIMISGKTNGESDALAVYAIISHDYMAISKPKTKINTGNLLNTWHKYEYELNFKTQSFNFYLDDKLKGKNIKFYSVAKNSQKVSGISTVKLGGSGSNTKAVFYDELYVGSDRTPANLNVKMEKVEDFNESTPFLQVGKNKKAPVIDGSLADKCWQQAAAFSPMVHPAGTKSPLKTDAFISYDDNNLYLGLRGYDEHLDPVLNKLDQIIKGKKGQDIAIWKHDSIELFIVPNPNSPNEYYHLGCNLAGGSYDSHPTKGAKWNSGISSKTKFYKKFWEMEIKIPLKSFGATKSLENSRWRFNICRNKKSDKSLACWSPTFGSFHNYSKFGELSFSNKSLQIFSLNNEVFESNEGSNQLLFSVNSPNAEEIEFRNIISYQNADIVANIEKAVIKANAPKTVKDRFFIFANAGSRKSSSNYTLTYEIRDARNQLVCRSAGYTTNLKRYTPIKSNFICTTSNVIFKNFSKLIINQDSSRPMLLLLQADKKLLPEIKKVNFQITMPDYIKLAKLDSNDISSCRPNDIKEKILTQNGKKYRQITMSIDRKWLYSTLKMGVKQPYNNWTLITFTCNNNAPITKSESISYKAFVTIKGKKVSENLHKMSLQVLPTIKGGKVPAAYPVILASGPWMRVFKNMSRQERDMFLQNVKKSGCNFMSYDEHYMSKATLQQMREAGLNLYYDIPVNTPRTWRSNAFPGATEFLRKNPQYRAVSMTGKVHEENICFSVLAAPNSPYDIEMQKWITPRAKAANALMWDYEVAPTRKTSLCFCPRCMKEFASFVGVASVGPQQVVNKYHQKWLEFQSQRVAEISRKLYKCTKNANPKCKFWVYSGYQSKNTLTHYTVDWSKFTNGLDNAICGYGRPLQELNATIKAIAPKKLIAGLLMQLWWNSSYNYNRFRNSLFRRITDSNGGIIFWSDMEIDGRFWSGVADITSLIENHKEFFLNHQRGDELCQLKGMPNTNLAVLKNNRNQRLIFVFNPSGKAKKCTVTNLKVPNGAKLQDFYTSKIFESNQRAEITVPGFDVKVLVLK